MKKKIRNGLKDFMRELVFGMEDGLVSNLGIVLAVWVATKNANVILLSGLASMFAGALSMSAGSYLSSKSVGEVYDAQVLKAKELVSKNPKKASREMKTFLKNEKFDDDEINSMMRHFLHHNKETFAINYIQKKLHLSPKGNSHPMHDAAVMFMAFAFGSLFPIIPFFFGASVNVMIISVSLTIATLFAVGAGKATVTHRKCIDSGVEIVLVGVGAGGLGYLVGHIFSLII
jgi:vacuolar iron transporter family protein